MCRGVSGKPSRGALLIANKRVMIAGAGMAGREIWAKWHEGVTLITNKWMGQGTRVR